MVNLQICFALIWNSLYIIYSQQIKEINIKDINHSDCFGHSAACMSRCCKVTCRKSLTIDYRCSKQKVQFSVAYFGNIAMTTFIFLKS